MNVHRKTLYVGVFLVAAGSVMLLAGSGAVDRDAITRAIGLWPLLIVGLGVGLLVRETRLSLAGGVFAAAMPGLLLGGLVVTAPHVDLDCGLRDPKAWATREGTFDGTAVVDLDLSCGEMTVTTIPGSGWQVRTGTGRASTIDAAARRLSVSSTEGDGHFGAPWRTDAWSVALPTEVGFDLATALNAGRGTIDLAGARLGSVDLEVNAGDLRVDLTGATLTRLSMDVSAAGASVRLPGASSFAADLNVNAGKLDVCIPAGLGVRIRPDGEFADTSYAGLVRRGDAWETPGYSFATHHADVTISVNVGSVDIDPAGGCK